MTRVGIDLGQFIADPYTSGIQRVLQYLARGWPSEEVVADFVIPFADGYLIAPPPQAAELLNEAFTAASPTELREMVAARVQQLSDECLHVGLGTLVSIYSRWILPEVSYLPSVLERLRIFEQSMPVIMIGYDTLPMTDPGNYRFVPGANAQVSEYFRLLTQADSIVCISECARDSILRRLRRDPTLPITVAHPGGDHVMDIEVARDGAESTGGTGLTFLRVGTMEARKMPREILEAFLSARERNPNICLTFVGNPSASDTAINEAIREAVAADLGVSWIEGASDGDVWRYMQAADAFLSLGIEGYGIPVLEAAMLGTPTLYGGIQPAAEIMEGRGARCLGELDTVEIVESLLSWAEPGRIRELSSEIDRQAVPRWRDFVHHVAERCVG